VIALGLLALAASQATPSRGDDRPDAVRTFIQRCIGEQATSQRGQSIEANKAPQWLGLSPFLKKAQMSVERDDIMDAYLVRTKLHPLRGARSYGSCALTFPKQASRIIFDNLLMTMGGRADTYRLLRYRLPQLGSTDVRPELTDMFPVKKKLVVGMQLDTLSWTIISADNRQMITLESTNRAQYQLLRLENRTKLAEQF
jgi:hypothetical protein